MYEVNPFDPEQIEEFENELEVMNEWDEFPMSPSFAMELDPEEAADMERSAAQGQWMDAYLDAMDDLDMT